MKNTSPSQVRNYTCRFVLICFPSNVFTIFRHDFLKENSPVELFFLYNYKLWYLNCP